MSSANSVVAPTTPVVPEYVKQQEHKACTDTCVKWIASPSGTYTAHSSTYGRDFLECLARCRNFSDKVDSTVVLLKK